MDEYYREEAYRIYVTQSLQLIPQNKYLTVTYRDSINPKKVDNRSGDDIVLDIMTKAGLKFR